MQPNMEILIFVVLYTQSFMHFVVVLGKIV
jgi:hypothetical protein